MEFLSSENIKLIINYIKTDLSSKNITLSNELKYEKIVRKLCTTIYENNSSLSLEKLNNIALEKIIPFISNTIIKPSKNIKDNNNKNIETSLVIDTGTSAKSYVVNKSDIYWEDFAFTLSNIISITEPTDIFLTSICICNPAPIDKCLYFTIKIDEFKQLSYSNNYDLNNKIVIPNKLDSKDKLIYNYSINPYYISTLENSKISILNIKVKNHDNTQTIFKDESSENRIILTFNLKLRNY